MVLKPDGPDSRLYRLCNVFGTSQLPGGTSKVEELLLDWTAVQAAVNDNSAIGQDALVKQVTVDGSVATTVPHLRRVAVGLFNYCH
jgi:hypothetical protein